MFLHCRPSYITLLSGQCYTFGLLLSSKAVVQFNEKVIKICDPVAFRRVMSFMTPRGLAMFSHILPCVFQVSLHVVLLFRASKPLHSQFSGLLVGFIPKYTGAERTECQGDYSET